MLCVVTCCHVLPHFAHTHTSPCQLVTGNRGTSATTPFVPTPSGSRQEAALGRLLARGSNEEYNILDIL